MPIDEQKKYHGLHIYGNAETGYIDSLYGIDVPEYIQSRIVSVQTRVMGEKTTVCLLKLENGFEVVGTSACVDPAHFYRAVGEKWAFKQALDKLEELDGFMRQSSLGVQS